MALVRIASCDLQEIEQNTENDVDFLALWGTCQIIVQIWDCEVSRTYVQTRVTITPQFNSKWCQFTQGVQPVLSYCNSRRCQFTRRVACPFILQRYLLIWIVCSRIAWQRVGLRYYRLQKLKASCEALQTRKFRVSGIGSSFQYEKFYRFSTYLTWHIYRCIEFGQT